MQKPLLTLLIIVLVQITQAQQTPIYTHQLLNGYSLNPAKAGASDNLNVFMQYRNQWTEMPGSPETTVITADGVLNGKKIGLGLNLVKDVANIIGQTSGMGTFSYFVNLTENQSLSMGLSVGFTRNEIYFDRIKADNTFDPSILYSTDSRTKFDADFGLNYKYKELEIGFISKHLPATNYLYEKNEDFKALNYQLVRHYIVNAQYKYSLPESKLDLTPNLLLKSAQGLPIQYEI